MLFNDVIGQMPLKRHLTNLVRQNRLGHALLFLGKEGYGALPLATAFSQYMVCERRGDDACGECASCRKAAALAHPDIHFSYPVVSRKGADKTISTDWIVEWREFLRTNPYGNAFDWLQCMEAENKQGNISTHECTDIIRKLNLKSFESGYKILVLWMAEYLGKEGNKLLKLIEEPPPDTLFILIAENESAILPTIVSRTQLVRLPPITEADIEHALTSQHKATSEQARQVAIVSGGSYREALQQLEHAGQDWMTDVREWLNSIMKSGPVAQVKWIEEMGKHGREQQKQFLRYFSHLLQQAVRLQVAPDTGAVLPQAEHDFATRFNNVAGIAQLQAIIEELDKASFHIERNAHGRILFHALTIRLYHIIARKSVILTT